MQQILLIVDDRLLVNRFIGGKAGKGMNISQVFLNGVLAFFLALQVVQKGDGLVFA